MAFLQPKPLGADFADFSGFSDESGVGKRWWQAGP
jgi:hypothetical protein